MKVFPRTKMSPVEVVVYVFSLIFGWAVTLYDLASPLIFITLGFSAGLVAPPTELSFDETYQVMNLLIFVIVFALVLKALFRYGILIRYPKVTK
jgi:hypothetical protein